MQKFAIIGFGCAGYHAVRQLRERCPSAVIDVFEKTEHGAANPVLTTYYAKGTIGFERMFPFGNMDEICKELDLNLNLEVVLRVECDAKEVFTEGGASYKYDKILICTGASAFLPPIDNSVGKELFFMRTVQDAEKLKGVLAKRGAKTAVVIGASVVGVKVAEMLNNHGIKTSLLEAADRIFPLSAYPSVSSKIEKALEEKGVRMIMDTQIEEVVLEGVKLGCGSVVPADIICLCVGTRANTALVANTEVIEGQSINIKRGIIVNTKMETSVPDIYAAGDCCEGLNLLTGETMIIGLWANAARQGEVAGSNMAGDNVVYSGNIPHNITRFFDMTFAGLGDVAVKGENRSFVGDETEVHVTINNGVIKCINIFGNTEISGVLKSLLIKSLDENRRGLSPLQREVLKKAGLPDDFIKFIGGSAFEMLKKMRILKPALGGESRPVCMSCIHCAKAPCVNACPAGCVSKGPTGFTVHDNTKCIGCQSCSIACPFAAPAFDVDGKILICDNCKNHAEHSLDTADVHTCANYILSTVEAEIQSKKSRVIADHGKLMMPK